MLLLVSSFYAPALVAQLLVGAGSEPFALTTIGVSLILAGYFVRKCMSRGRAQNLRNPKSNEITKIVAVSRAREACPRPGPGARPPRFLGGTVEPRKTWQSWHAKRQPTNGRLTRRAQAG